VVRYHAFFLLSYFLFSNTAPSTCPIISSVPEDNAFDIDSNASEGLRLGIIEPVNADVYSFNDMPPLPDPPQQVVTGKQSIAEVSRSTVAKSWVWAYFKKPDSSKKNCSCTICNKEVNYSTTKSTGALAEHVKWYHKSFWQNRLCEKAEAEVAISTGRAVPAHCPSKVS